jgi:hypothetical protein
MQVSALPKADCKATQSPNRLLQPPHQRRLQGRKAEVGQGAMPPNPSIEGDVQELSLLAAPHVKR